MTDQAELLSRAQQAAHEFASPDLLGGMNFGVRCIAPLKALYEEMKEMAAEQGDQTHPSIIRAIQDIEGQAGHNRFIPDVLGAAFYNNFNQKALVSEQVLIQEISNLVQKYETIDRNPLAHMHSSFDPCCAAEFQGAAQKVATIIEKNTPAKSDPRLVSLISNLQGWGNMYYNNSNALGTAFKKYVVEGCRSAKPPGAKDVYRFEMVKL